MFRMTNFVWHPVVSFLRPNIYLNILNSGSFNVSVVAWVVTAANAINRFSAYPTRGL